MTCTVCSKDKDTLTAIRSGINSKFTLTVCDECKAGGLEPRFLIIITGRKQGFNSVKDYVSKHRYVGPDILASEFA